MDGITLKILEKITFKIETTTKIDLVTLLRNNEGKLKQYKKNKAKLVN